MITSFIIVFIVAVFFIILWSYYEIEMYFSVPEASQSTCERSVRGVAINLQTETKFNPLNRIAMGYYDDETYDEYNGTYVQDVEGWSDQMIDDVLDGEPDAYWNIDQAIKSMRIYTSPQSHAFAPYTIHNLFGLEFFDIPAKI